MHSPTREDGLTPGKLWHESWHKRMCYMQHPHLRVAAQDTGKALEVQVLLRVMPTCMPPIVKHHPPQKYHHMPHQRIDLRSLLFSGKKMPAQAAWRHQQRRSG